MSRSIVERCRGGRPPRRSTQGQRRAHAGAALRGPGSGSALSAWRLDGRVALAVALAVGLSTAPRWALADPQPAPAVAPEGAPASPPTATPPVPTTAPAPTTAPVPTATPVPTTAPAPVAAPTAGAAATPARRPVGRSSIDQRGLAWDLRVEGGIGVWTSRDDHPFWGRLHGGLLLWSEPMVLGVGAFAEVGGLAGVGGGVMVDVTDIGAGWWAQLGAAGTEGPALVTHVALGWSFLGVEWQHRIDEAGSDNGVFIKLCAPIGIIVSRLAWHRQFSAPAAQ